MFANLATYIDRVDTRKTTSKTPEPLRMPEGTKEIKITEVAADSKQYGAINNSVSGNTVTTTFEFLQLHFNSAMAVVVLVALVVALCCCWRACKVKNLKKIARFLCINKCKVTEQMLEDEDKPRSVRLNTGSAVEIRDLETVIDMAHKSAIENAILRNARMAPTLEEENPQASC